MAKSSGKLGQYQKVMPVTKKNIGKNQLKAGVGAGPDNGTKAAIRRLKQLTRQALREKLKQVSD